MVARAVLIWLNLLAMASLNGGFREGVLVPRIGRGPGQAVSTVMLSSLIVVLGWIALPWIAPRSLQGADASVFEASRGRDPRRTTQTS
jgi:hypothetical protein